VIGAEIVNKIFETFSNHNPDPKIELEYKNPFTLLVAVLLSAQSTDKMVNIVTREVFNKYYTPELMLTLTQSELENLIKRIGFYRMKAKNILSLSHIILQDYNGLVPDNLTDLIKLPGIGRKSADVILNSIFHKATIAVDRHVFRVSHRIGLSDKNTAAMVSDHLLEIIPQKWHQRAHHWLVLHGRYVCIARKPKCHICNISQMCKYNLSKVS